MLLAHASQQNADKKSLDPFLHLPLLRDILYIVFIVLISNHNTAVHKLNFSSKKHMNYFKIGHVLDANYRKQYCAYRSILWKQSFSCINGRCTN